MAKVHTKSFQVENAQSTNKRIINRIFLSDDENNIYRFMFRLLRFQWLESQIIV